MFHPVLFQIEIHMFESCSKRVKLVHTTYYSKVCANNSLICSSFCDIVQVYSTYS